MKRVCLKILHRKRQRLWNLCTVKKKKNSFQAVFKLDRPSFWKLELHENTFLFSVETGHSFVITAADLYCNLTLYHYLHFHQNSLFLLFSPPSVPSPLLQEYSYWGIDRNQSQREQPELSTEQTLREGISQVSGSRHSLENVS